MVLEMPELSRMIREYLRKRGGEPKNIEVSEYFYARDGRWWDARITVDGVKDAETCRKLGEYLAKMTGAKLRSRPVFVPGTNIIPSSCWIELTK